MDDISRQFLQEHKGVLEPSLTQLPLPGQKATIIIGTTNVHNNIHHHINLHFFGHDLEHRFFDKNGITPQFQAVIQWKALEGAMRGTPEQDKLGVFNVINGKWPTNMVQASWDSNKSPLCQRCVDRDETIPHVFSCTSDNASKAFKKAMTAFKQDLKKCNTALIISCAFENIFLRVRKGYNIPLPPNKYHTQEMNDLLTKTLNHQLEMGTSGFLRGILSSNWDVIQNIYLKKKDFNDEDTDWATKTIRATWKFCTFMWKSRCDFVHGENEGKLTSARRKELLRLIQLELERTQYVADHSAVQLRKNVKKSLGNAIVSALEIWLTMLRNI